MITVALIGPDSEGKSTLCDLLETQPVAASDDARPRAGHLHGFMPCHGLSDLPSGYGATAPAALAPELGSPT